MVPAVVLALFPLVALSSCPEGDGSCPIKVGQQLLQASMNPGHDLLAMQVSSETAERLLEGLHVDLVDIGKYVESLVANVSGHNHTMSDAEKSSLEIIEKMVGNMQSASDTEHAEDQAEVDRMRDLIQNCTSHATASLAKVAAHNESVNSTRTAHATCREDEALARDAKDLACATYDSHRGSNAPPACMPTALSAEYVKTDDSAKKKQMESCLEAAKSWLSPFYTKYEDCKSKKDAHTTNRTECGSKQKAFEQAFCTYESKLEDACDAQRSCREKAIAARNAAHDGVKKSETARKADFAASRRLLCFLDVLRANNTHKEKTLNKCQKLEKQTSKYDIVYPAIPSPTDCTKEKTKPCDSDWTSQQYETQAWHKKANASTCQPCPMPATTTTTSTPTPSTTTTTTTATTTTTTTTITTTAQVANVKSCIIKNQQGVKKANCNAGWCDFKAYPSYNCASGSVVGECQGEAGIKLCKDKIKQKKPFSNGKAYQLFNHVTGSTRSPCVGQLVEKPVTDGVKEFWFPHGDWQGRGDRHMWFYCG